MLTIVAGYPGSGKSAYARKLAGETGVVLDLDELVGAICGSAPHERPTDERARLAVNAAFWDLACACFNQGLEVVAIRTAPSAGEMQSYGLAARRVILDVPAEVCRARIASRGDYDPERFREACRKVDDFRRIYANRFEKIQPL